jgi:tyrosyl-tRNA synthetase
MSAGTKFSAAFSALQRRGCISVSTPSLAASISALLDAPRARGAPPPSVYAGFDPTAPSLHLGHASVIIFLRRLARAGLRPIALVGGATALVGDPTGRVSARPALSREEAQANAARFAACLGPALGDDCLVVDNADTYARMGVLEFLRDVGSHFRLAGLLQRDTVRTRMGWARTGEAGLEENKETQQQASGMSFTELAYPLLQAHDFASLAAAHGAVLQVGGADQWGNIAAGVDHVRRRGAADASSGGEAAAVHGATVPLLLDSTGRKFGKSEGNVPVWLDAQLTSAHALWQHLFAIADADAPKLLMALSPASDEEQDAAIAELAAAPEKKAAQRLLADSLVHLLRGEKGLASAHRTAALLFGGTGAWSHGVKNSTAGQQALPQRALLSELRADDILALAGEGEVGRTRTTLADLRLPGSLPLLLVASGLVKSKNDARRLIDGGGVYWNWERVSPSEGSWATTGDGSAIRSARLETDFVDGRAAVISVGKRKMAVVELE